MAKFNQVFTKEYVNPETGEVQEIEIEKTFTYKISPDQFYMIFLGHFSTQLGLKSNTAKNLLMWFCEHAEFNTGKVLLPTAIRKELCETLNISSTNLANNIRLLKNANLITGSNGVFIINPQIFWKGDITTRNKILRDKEMQISFKIGQ